MYEACPHTDGCCPERPVIADVNLQPAAHQIANDGPDVDAHVVQRISGISSLIAGRIQLTYQRADIWFEKTGAGYDKYQSDKKRAVMRDRQQQVPTHDNDAAIPDGILTTDHAVSNPSAG